MILREKRSMATPSEVPVSEIGDADSPIALSDSSHESDDDAAPGFSAGLLQGYNKCSSTISIDLSPIS